jgi:hypothetical protein
MVIGDILRRPLGKGMDCLKALLVSTMPKGLDKDVATVIADAVLNRLESTDVKECIRIARLTHGNIDLSKLDKILDTFVRYSAVAD